ncbi:hypothetical protein [Streptococcus devriesei]|uniref:hypothetical protein n=1 Tax=Streptococcus devriesei TaxID=231233 RepID=UPI0004209FC8|nr:hypothetical protein [Streptococcus devriesei]
MKKIIIWISAIFLVIVLAGGIYIVGWGMPGNVLHTKISYGHSKIYTLKDRKAAANLIRRNFIAFNGCRLETLDYTSDKRSQEMLVSKKHMDADRYKEKYDKKDASKTYDECIVYQSSFSTDGCPDAGFSANSHYSHWNWILVRKKGGPWRLYSYGHD